MTIVSICTDMAALRLTGAVSEGSPYRGILEGRSGAHVHYNGNSSAIILSSSEGLEALELLPYVTVTSYEEIFGYRTQATIGGVLQWVDAEAEPRVPVYENTLGDASMLALYQSVYDYTPYVDGEGNAVTPSKLFAAFAGDDMSHLTL